MKKTFLSIGAIVLVAIAGFGVAKSMNNNNESKFSVQIMANVEALTGGEIEVGNLCYGLTDKSCVVFGVTYQWYTIYK